MASLPFPFRECIGSYYQYDNIFDFIGDGANATVYKAEALLSAVEAVRADLQDGVGLVMPPDNRNPASLHKAGAVPSPMRGGSHLFPFSPWGTPPISHPLPRHSATDPGDRVAGMQKPGSCSSLFASHAALFSPMASPTFSDWEAAASSCSRKAEEEEEEEEEPGVLLREGMLVALKVIHKSTLMSERACRDVINEVEVLRRVHHPNCVALLDCFQTSSSVVLVLSYLEGSRELFTAMQHQVFDESLAQCVMWQLLQALSYLHHITHIVHRDVKPENILVAKQPDGSEHVLLVDFGLARWMGDADATDRQRSGASAKAKAATLSSSHECIVPVETSSRPTSRSSSSAAILGSSSQHHHNDANGPPNPPQRRLPQRRTPRIQAMAGVVPCKEEERHTSLQPPPHPGCEISIHLPEPLTTPVLLASAAPVADPITRAFQQHQQQRQPPAVASSQPPHRCFGLETKTSVDSPCDSPVESTPCGTLRYAAPETVKSIQEHVHLYTTKRLLPRVDVYSAGIVLHLLLSRELPFTMNGNKLQLFRAMEHGPQFTSSAWALISPSGRELIAALMHFDPHKRCEANTALKFEWFAEIRKLLNISADAVEDVEEVLLEDEDEEPEAVAVRQREEERERRAATAARRALQKAERVFTRERQKVEATSAGVDPRQLEYEQQILQKRLEEEPHRLSGVQLLSQGPEERQKGRAKEKGWRAQKIASEAVAHPPRATTTTTAQYDTEEQPTALQTKEDTGVVLTTFSRDVSKESCSSSESMSRHQPRRRTGDAGSNSSSSSSPSRDANATLVSTSISTGGVPDPAAGVPLPLHQNVAGVATLTTTTTAISAAPQDTAGTCITQLVEVGGTLHSQSAANNSSSMTLTTALQNHLPPPPSSNSSTRHLPSGESTSSANAAVSRASIGKRGRCLLPLSPMVASVSSSLSLGFEAPHFRGPSLHPTHGENHRLSVLEDRDYVRRAFDDMVAPESQVVEQVAEVWREMEHRNDPQASGAPRQQTPLLRHSCSSWGGSYSNGNSSNTAERAALEQSNNAGMLPNSNTAAGFYAAMSLLKSMSSITANTKGTTATPTHTNQPHHLHPSPVPDHNHDSSSTRLEARGGGGSSTTPNNGSTNSPGRWGTASLLLSDTSTGGLPSAAASVAEEEEEERRRKLYEEAERTQRCGPIGTALYASSLHGPRTPTKSGTTPASRSRVTTRTAKHPTLHAWTGDRSSEKSQRRSSGDGGCSGVWDGVQSQEETYGNPLHIATRTSVHSTPHSSKGGSTTHMAHPPCTSPTMTKELFSRSSLCTATTEEQRISPPQSFSLFASHSTSASPQIHSSSSSPPNDEHHHHPSSSLTTFTTNHTTKKSGTVSKSSPYPSKGNDGGGGSKEGEAAPPSTPMTTEETDVVPFDTIREKNRDNVLFFTVSHPSRRSQPPPSVGVRDTVPL